MLARVGLVAIALIGLLAVLTAGGGAPQSPDAAQLSAGEQSPDAAQPPAGTQSTAQAPPAAPEAAAPAMIPVGPLGLIYLQPLGADWADAETALVRAAIEETFGFEVRVLSAAGLPEEAYYAPRHRHRAEKLLAYLQGLLPADGLRILGLTCRDVSTTQGSTYDWGVVGLASYDMPTGIVSTYRTRQAAHSVAHAQERLRKVAIHEIGHTLGLRHCSNPTCIMQDAGGQLAPIDRGSHLCEDCLGSLRAAGFLAPVALQATAEPALESAGAPLPAAPAEDPAALPGALPGTPGGMQGSQELPAETRS